MDGLSIFLTIANYSTFLICCVNKLPQILILTKAKSAKGCSLKGLLLELAGYVAFTTYQLYYGYPIINYLEFPALILQDTIMLFLILNYNGSLRTGLIYSVLFVGGLRLLTLHAWIVDMAMSLCTFFNASSKFIHLQNLYRSKDSSHVSALSWGMSTYTSLTRVVTTLLTTADKQVLLRVSLLSTLNSLMLAMILRYRRASGKQE